jgi:ribosomal protein S18 acetylase RimI-like enzyme
MTSHSGGPAGVVQPAAVAVVAATPDDWAAWRDLRRRALTDAPDAFGASLEREQGYTEQDWRSRLEGGRCVLARTVDEPGGETVGMGGSYEEEPGTWAVVSMWVAPEVRGQGVGGRILEAVLSRPRTDGSRVQLWVADGNLAARRVYERAGFEATEEREPIRPGASLQKQRMVLRPHRR